MTPETILVVEDESDIAFPLGRTLEREGYDVAWVDNGREAFDVVDDGPVAVVILELSLPDMDGVDLCQALRADDYLLKPFGLAELLDVTIGRLRAKLEEARLPDQIVAVRGVGFRLEQAVDAV